MLQVVIFMHNRLVDFRLFFSIDIDHLGVTAVFKIGYSSITPSMFVISEQGPFGVS